MAKSGTGAAARPSAWPSPAVLIGMVVAAVAGGLGNSHGGDGEDPSYLLGYLLGASAFRALLVWLVVWLVHFRGRDRPGAGPAYLLILGAAVLGAFASNLYQAGQADAVRASLSQTLARYEAGEREVVTTPVATGDMGRIEQFGKESLKIEAEDRRAYETQLRAAGLDEAMAPQLLAKADGLDQARARLRAVSEVVARHRALGRSRVVELRAKAEALPIAPAARRGLIAGLDKGEQARGPARERLWDIEQAIVGEYVAAIDVLERARGRWGLEAGVLRFDRQAELDAFNAHIDRTKALGIEQQAIVAAQMKQRQAALTPRQVTR